MKILPRYRVDDANKITISKKKSNNKRKTTEQYKQELEIYTPTIEVLDEYVNAKTRILHKCKICDYKWLISPTHIFKLGECPQCKHQKIVSDKNAELLKSHKKKIKDKFNSKIEVLSDSYISSKNKLLYHCNICNNIWEKLPNDILNTNGCPKCTYKLKGINQRMSYSDFIKTVMLDSIIVIESTYRGTNYPVDCKCKTCNYKWTVNQANSLRYIKIGCPKCANNIRLSHDEFIEKNKNNINENILLLGSYIDCVTPILCKCKKCGHLSYKMPKHIIDGQDCKKCSSIQRGEKNKLSQEEFEKRIRKRNKNILVEGKYNGYNSKVQCKCLICNTEWNPIASSIMKSTGCPFCSMSIGEQLIKYYLESNNIIYDYEYSFQDLKGINGGLLSYDFYLPQYNLLIEFQGIQHEKSSEYFGGKDHFVYQKEHDKRKRLYAENHSINFLEIWYYDIENIEKILDQYFKELNNLKSESLTTAG